MKNIWGIGVGVATAVLLFPQQDAVLVHNRLGTGNSYLKVAKSARLYYVQGLMNGILLAPLFGAPKEKTQWIERCVEGMTDEQISEIIAQYLRPRPKMWHEQLHALSFQAL